MKKSLLLTLFVLLAFSSIGQIGLKGSGNGQIMLSGTGDGYVSCVGVDFVYEAETEALWARLTGTPSDDWKIAVNAFIKSLKDDGIWTKIEFLHVYAFQNSTDALLNWHSSSYNGTAFNSPTFTKGEGYQGNGTNMYIDSDWNASTDAVAYSQNNACVLVYRYTDATLTGLRADCGATQSASSFTVISKNSGTQFRSFLNSSAACSQLDVGTGMYCVSRNNGTTFDMYHDATAYPAQSCASVAIPNNTFFSLAYDLNGSPAGYTDSEISMVCVCTYLTSTEYTNFRTAFNQYLTDINGLP